MATKSEEFEEEMAINDEAKAPTRQFCFYAIEKVLKHWKTSAEENKCTIYAAKIFITTPINLLWKPLRVQLLHNWLQN